MLEEQPAKEPKDLLQNDLTLESMELPNPVHRKEARQPDKGSHRRNGVDQVMNCLSR